MKSFGAFALAFICSCTPVLAGTPPDQPKSSPILIHERVNDSCELVRRGQLLQYPDYSAVVIDGVPGELYSLELSSTDFIEPIAEAAKRIKGAARSGFIVRNGTMASPPPDSPRVATLANGAECPSLQNAIQLVDSHHLTRKAEIQAKLYRPDVDGVTRPIPEQVPQAKSDTVNGATSADRNLPPAKLKITHGTVILAVAIGPAGAVKDAKVARSLDPYLDAKAIDEVRKWKFRPARKLALPVAALMTVEVNFNLH